MKVVQYNIPFAGGSYLSFGLNIEKGAKYLSSRVKDGQPIIFFLVKDDEENKEHHIYYLSKDITLNDGQVYLGTINLRKFYKTDFDAYYHLFE